MTRYRVAHLVAGYRTFGCFPAVDLMLLAPVLLSLDPGSWADVSDAHFPRTSAPCGLMRFNKGTSDLSGDEIIEIITNLK